MPLYLSSRSETSSVTYENRGRQRRRLREDHPDVKLDLALDAMTS